MLSSRVDLAFSPYVRAGGLIRSRKGLCPQPKDLLPKSGEVDVSAEFSKEGMRACGETYMTFRRPTAEEHVCFSQRKRSFQFTHHFLFFFVFNFLLI